VCCRLVNKRGMKCGVKIILCALWAAAGVEQMDGVKIDSQLATVTSGESSKCRHYYYCNYLEGWSSISGRCRMFLFVNMSSTAVDSCSGCSDCNGLSFP
jgi:hypothetical protein